MTKLAPAYKILSSTLADIRKVTNHPLQLGYGEVLSECLVVGRIDDARILPYFRLSDAPFTLAVRSAMKSDDQQATLCMALRDFYEFFRPQSPIEWYKLKKEKANISLRNQPAWASVPPWRARSIQSYRDAIADGTLSDNRKNGFDSTIDVSGWASCGPVSSEKCEAEARRLYDLILSMQKNGYQRHDGKDGDVTGTALINEKKDWRWIITSGHHRASVLAALGFSEIPIRINLVVRRCEAAFWPHVCGKLYSEKEALQIFDNLFDGCIYRSARHRPMD